jgi:ADP-ribosyltransferase exoenzyme
MTSGGTCPQPEQRRVLGLPQRPGGDGRAVQDSRHHWYELARELHGAFADLDRAISRIGWSGQARTAFDARWSEFSGHGTEASQHAHEMGDHLLRVGNQIEDAQHAWDLAMGAMTASTAIGIGLTFVTFGISDAVAEGAATAAVGTMEAICATLDVTLDAALQLLAAAIRVAAQLAVRFSWQVGINLASQEAANAVEGRGLGRVDLLQAAEFAGASVIVPGVLGNATVAGTRVFEGASGSVLIGTVTDVGIQGVEGSTEGKPFDVVEAVVSGALAGAGHIAAEEIRLRRAADTGEAPETEPGHAPPTEPRPIPPPEWDSPLSEDLLARLLADARELKADPRLAHIPDDELAAILGYTSEYRGVANYARINAALRSGDPAAITHLQPYIDGLRAGLDRLPDHHGMVYRGAQLSPEVIDAYRRAALSGQAMVEKGFTSASLSASRTFGGNARFVIRSVHGKDLASIGVSPFEQEVLFRAGTRFQVQSVTESPAGDHVITLWELR